MRLHSSLVSINKLLVRLPKSYIQSCGQLRSGRTYHQGLVR